MRRSWEVVGRNEAVKRMLREFEKENGKGAFMMADGRIFTHGESHNFKVLWERDGKFVFFCAHCLVLKVMYIAPDGNEWMPETKG